LNSFEKNFNIFLFSMVKWFAYIVLILIFAPCLLSAKINNKHFDTGLIKPGITALCIKNALTDTVPAKNSKKDHDDKKKIKEVARAKHQPRPEKLEPVETPAVSKKTKPKRQRRPEGLERPPEIPRRNGN
jgi:hypothetical protein